MNTYTYERTRLSFGQKLFAALSVIAIAALTFFTLAFVFLVKFVRSLFGGRRKPEPQPTQPNYRVNVHRRPPVGNAIDIEARRE